MTFQVSGRHFRDVEFYAVLIFQTMAISEILILGNQDMFRLQLQKYEAFDGVGSPCWI